MKIMKSSDGSVTVRNGRIFLVLSIAELIMFVLGVILFFDICLHDDSEPLDVAGVVIVSVWLCCVLAIGLVCFINALKVLTINSEGVLCRSIKKEFIAWADVKDWGLSYCGQTRFEGNTYYLYFSKEVLGRKNDERKRLKRATVKIIVLDSEFCEVLDGIVAPCRDYVQIPPFIPERKVHFF